MSHHRPSLQLAPQHLLALLFAAALLAPWLMGTKPDNRVEQVFYGPVNAPVSTYLSADQKADVRGEVHQ